MYVGSSNRLSSQSARGREEDETIGAVYNCLSPVLSAVLVFVASCVCIHTFCEYACVCACAPTGNMLNLTTSRTQAHRYVAVSPLLD